MSAKFLNVDLDICTKTGRDDFLKYFGAAVVNLNREDSNYLSLELNSQPQSIEEAVLAFYDLISSFPLDMLNLWSACEARSLSIGINSGNGHYSTDFCLSSKTMSLIALMNVDFVITIYGAAGA